MTTKKRTSKFKIEQQRLNLSSIVQRLPFHRRLNESQASILKITPIWHEWCDNQREMRGNRHFSASSDTHLVSIEDGLLTLSCSNSSTATLIKHQQSTLLDYLHKAGFGQVQKLRVRMAVTGTNQESLATHTYGTSKHRAPETDRKKPQLSSIKSVEAVQRKIENEHLASALKRLAETLRNQ